MSHPTSLETSEDGTLAMVLEDAGPRNLADLLGERPLEVGPFFDLAVAMAEVVGAVHHRNILHRDICPENFVVRSDPLSVVLVDFESATTVSSFAERGVAPTELTGALVYTAPEATGRMAGVLLPPRLLELREDRRPRAPSASSGRDGS